MKKVLKYFKTFIFAAIFFVYGLLFQVLHQE